MLLIRFIWNIVADFLLKKVINPLLVILKGMGTGIQIALVWPSLGIVLLFGEDNKWADRLSTILAIPHFLLLGYCFVRTAGSGTGSRSSNSYLILAILFGIIAAIKKAAEEFKEGYPVEFELDWPQKRPRKNP
jgi:hypothetical protein